MREAFSMYAGAITHRASLYRAKALFLFEVENMHENAHVLKLLTPDRIQSIEFLVKCSGWVNKIM